jgi:hypothetical protein
MRGRFVVVALTATALGPAVAQAQTPAAKSVTAVGTAEVKVEPANRHSNDSIKAAVEKAEADAQPKALAAARDDAARLAQTAGLTLGAVTSISDAPSSPYFFPYGIQGTFGPGKYCGNTRSVHVKHLANGKTKRVVGKLHRVCRVPSEAVVSVTVTFAAS